MYLNIMHALMTGRVLNTPCVAALLEGEIAQVMALPMRHKAAYSSNRWVERCHPEGWILGIDWWGNDDMRV